MVADVLVLHLQVARNLRGADITEHVQGLRRARAAAELVDQALVGDFDDRGGVLIVPVIALDLDIVDLIAGAQPGDDDGIVRRGGRHRASWARVRHEVIDAEREQGRKAWRERVAVRGDRRRAARNDLQNARGPDQLGIGRCHQVVEDLARLRLIGVGRRDPQPAGQREVLVVGQRADGGVADKDGCAVVGRVETVHTGRGIEGVLLVRRRGRDASEQVARVVHDIDIPAEGGRVRDGDSGAGNDVAFVVARDLADARGGKAHAVLRIRQHIDQNEARIGIAACVGGDRADAAAIGVVSRGCRGEQDALNLPVVVRQICRCPQRQVLLGEIREARVAQRMCRVGRYEIRPGRLCNRASENRKACGAVGLRLRHPVRIDAVDRAFTQKADDACRV